MKCSRCGASSLMLKVNAQGLCLSCATQQIANDARRIAELETRITPELRDAETVAATLVKRKAELAVVCESIEKQTKTQKELEERIAALNNKLLFVSDAVELETFALYTPRFEFASSETYKDRLLALRNDQKQMIRDKIAVVSTENWTVNGSKSEGKKLLADMVKLFIRSFNNECDAAVSDVKFSNYDRCRERILTAFETINRLGRVNNMSLAFQYRQSKLDELSLAFEYQRKKEEEKEALRALREQQREEAKLAKEIEAARKEAEKEKKHYQQALEKLHEQLLTCQNGQEREELLSKQNDLVAHMDDISAKLEDIDYRQSNQKAGYVYIISNIGAFGPDIYKIGMTRRLDPMERVYELGDASVPFMFDVHAMIFSDDAPKLETALHHAFEEKRVNMVNNRREYFHVSLDEIKQVVYANHDKTIEFTDAPAAEQYRESQRMRNLSWT